MFMISTLNTTLANCANKAKLMNQAGRPAKVIELEMYVNLIEKNWLIHYSLEGQIQKLIKSLPNQTMEDFFHSRLDWLRLDKRNLNLSTSVPLPIVLSSPEFKSVSEMLGGWFIVERSMVGNRMLYQWLRASPELSHISVFNFYRNYDDRLEDRWNNFQQLIIKNITNIEEAIVGAKKTFKFINTHLSSTCTSINAGRLDMYN